MTTNYNKQHHLINKNFKSENSLVDPIKVLTELTRKDIERSYNIDESKDTEINYSNRYGWSLRRIID